MLWEHSATLMEMKNLRRYAATSKIASSCQGAVTSMLRVAVFTKFKTAICSNQKTPEKAGRNYFVMQRWLSKQGQVLELTTAPSEPADLLSVELVELLPDP